MKFLNSYFIEFLKITFLQVIIYTYCLFPNCFRIKTSPPIFFCAITCQSYLRHLISPVCCRLPQLTQHWHTPTHSTCVCCKLEALAGNSVMSCDWWLWDKVSIQVIASSNDCVQYVRDLGASVQSKCQLNCTDIFIGEKGNL